MRIEMIRRVLKSPEEFYRRSLFGPYVAAALAFPFALFIRTEGFLQILAGVALSLLMVAIMGTIPHLAVSIPLSYWMRRQSSEQMRKTLLVWPLLLLASSFAFIALLNSWGGGMGPNGWSFIGYTALIVIGLGYAWVGSVLGLGRWLEKRGKFLNDPRHQQIQSQAAINTSPTKKVEILP